MAIEEKPTEEASEKPAERPKYVEPKTDHYKKWGARMLKNPTQNVSVARIKTKEFQDILDTMFKEIEGIGFGLAANQFGIPESFTVIEITPVPHRPNREIVPKTALINPKIIEYSKELQYGWEACLSCPGSTMFYVPRSKSIKATYLDRDANPVETTVTDLTAVVFQHEIDHLNGYICGERVLVVDGKVAKGAIISREEYFKNARQVPEGAKHLVKEEDTK